MMYKMALKYIKHMLKYLKIQVKYQEIQQRIDSSSKLLYTHGFIKDFLK